MEQRLFPKNAKKTGKELKHKTTPKATKVLNKRKNKAELKKCVVKILVC